MWNLLTNCNLPYPNFTSVCLLQAGQVTLVTFSFPFFAALTLDFKICLYSGSHVIYTLQKTRRYKVISIDNHHNSHPLALCRVSQLSKAELPENPTDAEIQSTDIDVYNLDLTKPEQVRSVFERYGPGGIWGVIHIAVRVILALQGPETTRRTSYRHTKLSVNLRKSL
jgi:UDP-glucose 4-epimerase